MNAPKIESVREMLAGKSPEEICSFIEELEHKADCIRVLEKSGRTLSPQSLHNIANEIELTALRARAFAAEEGVNLSKPAESADWWKGSDLDPKPRFNIGDN